MKNPILPDFQPETASDIAPTESLLAPDATAPLAGLSAAGHAPPKVDKPGTEGGTAGAA